MNHEWHTPREYVEAAREAMGGIDLDPASSASAQRSVRAAEFFTPEIDALAQEWHGRVFLNPPYARGVYLQFVEKLVAEFAAGHVPEAVLLLNNSTETKWFRLAARHSAAVCFVKGRIRYISPEGKRSTQIQGQVFVYFGHRPQAFAAVFRRYGLLTVGVSNSTQTVDSQQPLKTQAPDLCDSLVRDSTQTIPSLSPRCAA
jgi:ParB family chromosome partitioning protein